MTKFIKIILTILVLLFGFTTSCTVGFELGSSFSAFLIGSGTQSMYPGSGILSIGGYIVGLVIGIGGGTALSILIVIRLFWWRPKTSINNTDQNN